MKAYGWIGLALLLLSEFCLLRKIEPFFSWFYCFAWWSYILLADNLLLRVRGSSLLTGRRKELRTMLPLSVFIWLLFEGYNLVIRNWSYDGVPSQLWMRWPGYLLAFSTVLPGIFITSDLVEAIFMRDMAPFASESERLSGPPSSRPSRWFVLIGALMCIVPLVWPLYFFSTIWIGPILLLDPLLERLGLRSLSLMIAAGDRRRVWSLMLGGLFCGLLWEFWNFWAASKWIYAVPFFESWKVFEMPLLGFLGFPPFALECWILYHLLRTILHRPESVFVRIVLWSMMALVCFAFLRGIDTRTVVRFAELSHRSTFQ
jgi:hypothetical protein